MRCEECGSEDGCSCRRKAFLSFLSDFRGSPEVAEAADAADAADDESVTETPVAATPVPAGSRSRYDTQPSAYQAPPTEYHSPPPPSYSPPPGFDPPPPRQSYGPPPGFDPPPPRQRYGPPPGFDPPPPPRYVPPAAVGDGWNTGGGGWGDVVPARVDSVAGKRKRPLALIAGAAVAIVALVAGATVLLTRSSGPSLNGLTASQVLDKSLTAARKAGTVHVAVTQSDSNSTEQDSLDISLKGGTETSSLGGGTGKFLVVDGRLYFEADTGFWTNQFDVPDSYAQQLGGKWVAMPAGIDELKVYAQALTMPTIVDQLLALSGVVSKGPAQGKGQIAVTGTVPYNDFNKDSGAGDSATLVISSKSPFLPVSISYSDPDNGSVTMTFSNWGVPVPLTAPASPLTLPDSVASALAGGGSSSGSGAAVKPVTPVTASSTTPGVAVTPAEATSVATQLWNEREQILSTRNISALGTIDAGSAYEADLGFLCQFGCRLPATTLDKISVTVTRQASWPAVIFATASYTTCDTSGFSCNDTFVATQQAPNAAWHIVLVASWSGTAEAATPPADADGFSPAPNPPAANHVATLPSEYAAYLQAIKDTGAAPAGSRFGPDGPYTVRLIPTNYDPPSKQQANGQLDHTTYSVNPGDPVWQFAGSQGTTATCGTVRYVAQLKATAGNVLSQTAGSHPYGALALGTYQSVTLKGLHTVCMESSSAPATPVLVFGSWGDLTGATGVPVGGSPPTTVG